MKARHLILLALAAIPLPGAEEAVMPTSFVPMLRGLTEHQMRNNSADDALLRLHFSGEVSQATKERLKRVWNSGTGYADRLEALHGWMKELEADPGTTDAQVFLAWQAAHIWFASHGEPEHRLFMAHIRHTFASPEPAISRHLMSLFYQVDMLEILSRTGCVCDDFIAVSDAVNDTNPWLLESLYPMQSGISRMGMLNRLWRDPVAYGMQFAGSLHKSERNAVSLLSNDFPFLHREAKGSGLQRWRYTWGRDLPQAVDAAMEYIDARHNGVITPDKEVCTRIRRLTDDLSPDMLGFVPRSILAAAPGAMAWRPLWDDRASLYDMPDTTAVYLPGWNPELLSREALPPAEVLAADTARLDSLLQKAADSKTLPAMLAFSLIEDDLALPDGTRRSWMNVDGYDTFRAVFDIVLTPNLVDVLIDEKGPHFSKDDKELQSACRELNLTLHRCIVALALMERDGRREDLKKGCGALAKLLNRTGTWALVFNEYGLRGISPLVFTELVSRCSGGQALLRGFTELSLTTVAFSAAEHEGRGKVDPGVLAGYMRDMLVLRRDLYCSGEERARVAARWLQAAKDMPGNTGTAMVAYCYAWGAPEEILKSIPADPAEFSGCNAMRGCALYRYAMEHGDTAAQEKIIRAMTADKQNYGYPATRLACAMHARSRGRTADARRLEKDALILSIAEQHYAPDYAVWQSFFSFLQFGAAADLAKYQHICLRGVNRDLMARAVPALLEQGHFESAAFAAERLINLGIRDATPNNSTGTQQQIVCWRAMADIGHALYLYKTGDAAAADKLMEAALPLLLCDADTARRVVPVVLGCKEVDPARKEKFRGLLAAAAQKGSLPAAKVVAAAAKAAPRRTVAAQPEPDRLNTDGGLEIGFESPFYTWHPKDSAGRVTEIKGAIVRAWYESATESCWVIIKLESGRYVEFYLNQLATDDLRNIMDWKELNKIQVIRFCTADADSGGFNAKACRVYADSGKPGVANTYVELLTPYGERRTCPVWKLANENMAEVNKLPVEKDENPVLQCFDRLGPALAAADARKCSLRVCFLGEHGSEYERAFERDICSNPDKVRAWRKGFVNLLCFCDKDGNWSEAAQGIFSMVSGYLDEFLPPDSPQRAAFMKGGGVIEIPYEQRTGNLLAQNAGQVKLAISVKPDMFTGGAASADGMAALAAAIEKGDADTLRRLVKADPALLRRPCGSRGASSPLFHAVKQRKPAMVQALLESGANPNETDKGGYPVLCIACLQGNADSVKYLLEKGADPDKGPMAPSMFPEKPVNSTLGRLPVIRLLVEHGARVTPEDLFSILNLNGNHLDAADFIMQRCGDKLDLNARCVMGWDTMLGQMTRNKEAEKVEWLLAHGANARETTGAAGRKEQPLYALMFSPGYAQDPKSLRIVESFLKHGADPDAAVDSAGGKPLSVLAGCIGRDQWNFALLLLKYGAGADGTDAAGRPLLYAVAERSAFPANAANQATLLQLMDALVKNSASVADSAKDLPPLKQWAKESPGGKPRVSPDMLQWIESH